MGGRTKDDIIRTKNERLQNKQNPSKHRHKKDRKEKQKSSIVNIYISVQQSITTSAPLQNLKGLHTPKGREKKSIP